MCALSFTGAWAGAATVSALGRNLLFVSVCLSERKGANSVAALNAADRDVEAREVPIGTNLSSEGW